MTTPWDGSKAMDTAQTEIAALRAEVEKARSQGEAHAAGLRAEAREAWSQVEALRAEAEKWRYFAWALCPHEGKYGDDGEMQCRGADFKRGEADGLRQHVVQALQEYSASQRAEVERLKVEIESYERSYEIVVEQVRETERENAALLAKLAERDAIISEDGGLTYSRRLLIQRDQAEAKLVRIVEVVEAAKKERDRVLDLVGDLMNVDYSVLHCSAWTILQRLYEERAHQPMGVHAPQWCAECSRDLTMDEWVAWPCFFVRVAQVSVQPLPLGHQFEPCRHLHGRKSTHNCSAYEHCDECGEFEGAHRVEQEGKGEA